MTNEQMRMLRVVAAYNDVTEEQAEKAIVEDFLNWLAKDDSLPVYNLDLHIKKEQPETCKPEVQPTVAQIETPEKVRKKPGRKPKNFVEDTIREVRQNEKMSKDEFVDYFGGGK